MATPEFTSSVTSPPSGWAKPFPRDERLFLWLVAFSVAAMTAFVIGWLYLGHQNVPTDSYSISPAAYSAKVSAFAQRYGGADGRVYVPSGTDAYLLAARFSWYPDLVLQSGKRYRIWLSSADVLHGFSLVGQNLNLEVAPHHAMGAWLKLGKPGRYLVVCNEFCGLRHAQMSGHIDVISAKAMQSYLHAHPLSAAPGSTAAPTAGSPAAALPLRVRGNQLAFDKKTLVVRAGKVTITLTNPSPIPHNIAIKGNGVNVKGPVVTGGGRSTVSAVLKAGTYTFYCAVPGHFEAGMHGTLTVKP